MMVARRLGRRGIGIELNPEYVTESKERIIDDESKIPDEFKTGTLKMPLEFIPAEFLSETTITVDKSILAAAFPNGDAPGCHFSVISEYIRIK